MLKIQCISMDKYKEIHFDVDWGNAFPLDYLVKQSFFALSIIIPNNAILNFYNNLY